MADKADAKALHPLMRAPAYPGWLERIDLVRARVRLTDTDSVTIMALPLGELGDLIERGVRVLTDTFDVDDQEIARLDQIIEWLRGVPWGERFDAIVRLLDEVLARSIAGAEAPGVEQACGVSFHDAVSADPGVRDALWRALPLPVVRRIVTGIIIHSGNL